MGENEDQKKLQQFQQQAQILMIQKQNFQLQQAEIENAVKELEKSKEENVHELVGNILIKKKKSEVMPKLKDASETLKMRISSIDRQLDILTKKILTLQQKFSKKG